MATSIITHAREQGFFKFRKVEVCFVLVMITVVAVVDVAVIVIVVTVVAIIIFNIVSLPSTSPPHPHLCHRRGHIGHLLSMPSHGWLIKEVFMPWKHGHHVLAMDVLWKRCPAQTSVA